MKNFSELAIKKPQDLLFGKTVYPLSCGFGLTIGENQVYPELNFTLPSMEISQANWTDVKKHYSDIMETVLKRARKMFLPGLVIEFEQLPQMTENPEWGAEITILLKAYLKKLREEEGIANALRVTIVDLRDADRPPLLRSGKAVEQTFRAIELAVQAGADIISIESIGGKEVHDQSLMYGDTFGILASLGILATQDMQWLWKKIVDICRKNNCVPGGDTACGFANTAMQLAGKDMLPKVLAAVDRVASVPRSLQAYRAGAIGPSKDCAYEGPYIKAITGFPISMEGKSSCCAHFSPLGNIAGVAADLWSNESVQNIRLLSGPAPEAFLELLAYDCRLFNKAIESGKDKDYTQLLIESDAAFDAQAWVVKPEVVIDISKKIVNENDPWKQTLIAAKEACRSICQAVENDQLKIEENEKPWLKRISAEIDEIPDDKNQAIKMLERNYSEFFNSTAYGL